MKALDDIAASEKLQGLDSSRGEFDGTDLQFQLPSRIARTHVSGNGGALFFDARSLSESRALKKISDP